LQEILGPIVFFIALCAVIYTLLLIDKLAGMISSPSSLISSTPEQAFKALVKSPLYVSLGITGTLFGIMMLINLVEKWKNKRTLSRTNPTLPKQVDIQF
jgi:hypothetical protein